MKNKFENEVAIKNILTDLYSERYGTLRKSERPDFYNEYIGLEITTASLKDDIEINSFYIKYANKTKSNIPIKLLHKIEKKINLIFVNNILVGYSAKFTDLFAFIKEIQSIWFKKLEKLNKHYTIYKYNDLIIHIREYFPFAEDNQNNSELEIVNYFITSVKEIIVDSKNYNKIFDLVHILFENILITVNTENYSANYLII